MSDLLQFPPGSALPACPLCDYPDHWLGDHLRDEHGISCEVEEVDPNFPIASEKLVASYREKHPEPKERVPAGSLPVEIEFAGIRFPVNLDVPAEACLPLPAAYAVPRAGLLATDVQNVAIGVRCGRSLWVSGPQGTGKDAVFSALSALTRTPGILLQVVPGADIQSWLFTRAFDAAGTRWEEGQLLRVLRDGYLTPAGRRVPYLVVLSDIDRATKTQLEYLRLVLDSISGRVLGPNGETYAVLPGTRIVATANSTGAGDSTGAYVSVNPVDSSIIDRFSRKVLFHHMDPEDELPLLRAKFPLLTTRMPGVPRAMMEGVKAVRAAIAAEAVFCEFSHRAVCAWAEAVEDLIQTLPPGQKNSALVKRGARAVLDGLPNAETREAVLRLLDPHLTGGAIEEGDTRHISNQPLRPRSR